MDDEDMKRDIELIKKAIGNGDIELSELSNERLTQLLEYELEEDDKTKEVDSGEEIWISDDQWS